jgi:hypothetical protein
VSADQIDGAGPATLARWADHPSQFVREVFGATPDEWQDDVLEAFPVKRRIAMLASKGPGKAQPKDLLIPTPDGVRRFGDLQPGDRVFAGDGSPTTVTAVFDRGELPVFRVGFDDYSSTLACAEHLWKVRGAAERMREKKLGEVWSILSTAQIVERGVRTKNNKGEHRQFEIPRQGPVQYEGQVLPLDPYVLGVWLGDGVRRGGRYATKPTPEIEAKIRSLGFDTSGPRDGVVMVYGIAPLLREAGVIETYSHERFVPKAYLQASERGRRELLCGLLDTDCGVDKDGHMEFATTSPQLALDVIWLVRSLGGTAHETKIKHPFYRDTKRRRINGRPCHRVVVRVPFNPFMVPQRKARWTDPGRARATARYMTRYISSIEPAGTADCMCIRVAHPSRLYLTNDFIVTHNTAIEAWLAWNYLLTRQDCNIAAVSITGENLADNLWKEMSVWLHRSPLLQANFEWRKTRIERRGESAPRWWMSARSWPRNGSREEQADTLAGLHAEYVMFIMDESGGIPDSVLVSAEAALSTCIEGHILQGGNPTKREGALFRAHSERDRWHVVSVNGDPDSPKRSPRVSVEWARDQIRAYGRESPWVKVNVFGEFPPSSIDTLIGAEEVTAATLRSYRPEDIARAARILGVDVALYGDDASVIFPRQGLVAFAPQTFRNIDGIQGASQVSRKWDEWDADAAFVDNTGGYGTSWIDNLRLLGKAPIGVGFAEASSSGRYANKRAEMYFEAVQWIREGGQLPPMTTPGMPEFCAALSRTTYTTRGDRLLLEPKALVKERIGFSPDHTDGFVLTFAHPVTPKARRESGRPRHEVEYDPFAEVNKPPMGAARRHSFEYDPYQ